MKKLTQQQRDRLAYCSGWLRGMSSKKEISQDDVKILREASLLLDSFLPKNARYYKE